MEELMALLRDHFGRPEVIVPLLQKEILAISTVRDTYEGLRGVVTWVVKGYTSLIAHIGDSLSEFLTYL